MKALMILAWIVLGPFISNIVADFVNDFNEKSLSGGKFLLNFPAKKAVPDFDYPIKNIEPGPAPELG